MKIRTTLLMAMPLLLVFAGCNDRNTTNEQANKPASQTAPIQNAPTDTDPTPQTGTGGESQTTSPDSTVNSAPQGQSDTGTPQSQPGTGQTQQ